MLTKILELKGITVLNKQEQRNVKGGLSQSCRFTLIGPGGTTTHELPGFSDGMSGSSEAREVCNGVIDIDDTVDRCFYDCEYDGFGQ
ncbi:MAG: hypothetical protein AAF611_12240 [Bacteroidota bacterium]